MRNQFRCRKASEELRTFLDASNLTSEFGLLTVPEKGFEPKELLT
jgi:hypothetical protein